MPAVMSRREFDTRLQPLSLNLLYRAMAVVGDTDADDVVSETLVTAWKIIQKFNAACDQPAFLEWLQRICDFEINRCIREKARLNETTLPSLTLFEMCDGADAPVWEDEQWLTQREELYRRLHGMTLTPRQRECALRWVGGESLREIGASLQPQLSAMGVCYTIKRVAILLKQVDDADTLGQDTSECIRNMPAALSYQGQLQQWARYRKEANQYALNLKMGRR